MRASGAHDNPKTENFLSTMREDDLIQRIARAFGRSVALGFGMRRGIGDDAALWRASPGTETVLTCDWFLEGTHFLRGKHPADSVGWKGLARAVSDVAAMGGAPKCFLLSLTLPQALTGQWLDEFLRGLRRASQKFACQLAGGDTTRRAQVLISITVLGEVSRGQEVLRAGAHPGDSIFTSGHLGEAELGLRLLRDTRTRPNLRSRALKKHLYPEPRIALGRWLAKNRLATAMMDLSDGLSTDLPRLCAASGVGARINAARIPTARANAFPIQLKSELLGLALHGGDDYELLFTVSPRALKRIPRSFGGMPITAIGEITESRSLLLVETDGREQRFPNHGWDPFRRRC
jgi:thiamine-monophosphate kinase